MSRKDKITREAILEIQLPTNSWGWGSAQKMKKIIREIIQRSFSKLKT